MLWHVRNGDWLGTCRFVHLDWVANLVRQLADELGVEDDEHVAALHFVDNALLDFNLHLRRHNVSQKKDGVGCTLTSVNALSWLSLM